MYIYMYARSNLVILRILAICINSFLWGAPFHFFPAQQTTTILCIDDHMPFQPFLADLHGAFDLCLPLAQNALAEM